MHSKSSLRMDNLIDSFVEQNLSHTFQVIEKYCNSTVAVQQVVELSSLIVKSINTGGKVLIAGNGGSAADAQHFSAELVSRFLIERKAFPAIALTTDTSAITAVANDYGYTKVFERQIEALGKPSDVFIGITTSGTSGNILEAFRAAKKIGLTTVALTGEKGLAEDVKSDLLIQAPSASTPQIQEVHGILVHLCCAAVERLLTETL
jgi:D-sedoheptulose 7-phosphate isomerase